MLSLHEPVERELGRGLTDIFAVQVEAGQFLHVFVGKKGVTALVTLADGGDVEECTFEERAGPAPPEPPDPATWVYVTYVDYAGLAGRTRQAAQMRPTVRDEVKPWERNY
jgi:hypothetical protein